MSARVQCIDFRCDWDIFGIFIVLQGYPDQIYRSFYGSTGLNKSLPVLIGWTVWIVWIIIVRRGVGKELSKPWYGSMIRRIPVMLSLLIRRQKKRKGWMWSCLPVLEPRCSKLSCVNESIATYVLEYNYIDDHSILYYKEMKPHFHCTPLPLPTQYPSMSIVLNHLHPKLDKHQQKLRVIWSLSRSKRDDLDEF